MTHEARAFRSPTHASDDRCVHQYLLVVYVSGAVLSSGSSFVNLRLPKCHLSPIAGFDVGWSNWKSDKSTICRAPTPVTLNKPTCLALNLCKTLPSIAWGCYWLVCYTLFNRKARLPMISNWKQPRASKTSRAN